MKKILCLFMFIHLTFLGQSNYNEESNIPLFLPEGWSMFGYTCLESQDMIVAFSSINEEIVIVKDYLGNAYLPEWDFNGIGSLEFAMGYQIKMTQEVTNFQFCSTIPGGASQEELDAIQSELSLTQQSFTDLIEEMEEIVISYNEEDILNISEFVNSFLLDINNLLVSNELDLNTISELSENYLTPGITYLLDNSLITEEEISLIYDILFNVAELLVNQEDGITQADVDAAHAMYEGWCASDIDNDGVCDVDEVSGCMDAASCNYVSAAEFDDGSCDYVSCLDECGVPNGDSSSCTDCAGVVNGTSEDLGCGCGNPAQQDGFDCEGNQILNLEIGQEYAGGIIFQINEDGSGLVVNQVNLEEMNWFDAMNTAENSTSGGYDDWFLPTTNQLQLINQIIGYSGSESWWDGYNYESMGSVYWSSTDFVNSDDELLLNIVQVYDFYDFEWHDVSKFDSHLALFIRVFGNANVNFGCTNAESLNYNPQAVFEDFSCIIDNACPHDIFLEYSANAYNYDDSFCHNLIVEGCTDNTALNYNPQANLDYGTCQYLYGCTEYDADNYNEDATTDDGTCIYYGCTDLSAGNYNETANTDDGTCLIGGCTNSTAENYNSDAVIDDGTCIIYGCMLSVFPNYNWAATISDNSCDINSLDVFGCTNYSTWTYQENANIENGTCIYESPKIGDLAIGGIVFYIDETGDHGLVAAAEPIGHFIWGCTGVNINGADESFIGSGYQNTIDIANQACENGNWVVSAAQAALDYESHGYYNWYLPSSGELEHIYGALGGIYQTETGYWSSTEVDENTAFCESFGVGTETCYKSNGVKVLPIHAF